MNYDVLRQGHVSMTCYMRKRNRQRSAHEFLTDDISFIIFIIDLGEKKLHSL